MRVGEKPRHLHDCDSCDFLGRYAESDLYYCKRCDGGSVIARRSSEPSNYSSMPLAMLLRSAIEELANGTPDMYGNNYPPRQGAPLHVAACRVLRNQDVKVRVENA